ncbi:hypothetical protein NDU88_006208 [Pleurodeles waltl]|uniref:Uncharacterized protein n=1 Tax=Pleurodeles waltl TaxID=8319 RepID=A0AAV7LQ51_PLEWA|nr:hypothetical protein NDU88_006208 [Pleurodeles waltl]
MGLPMLWAASALGSPGSGPQRAQRLRLKSNSESAAPSDGRGSSGAGPQSRGSRTKSHLLRRLQGRSANAFTPRLQPLSGSRQRRAASRSGDAGREAGRWATPSPTRHGRSPNCRLFTSVRGVRFGVDVQRCWFPLQSLRRLTLLEGGGV